uniref:Uncharacterized protein n=1 Tax=Rhizophora mucronata TaxID=61149 RepID=A0A2P2P342_RHIMU
MSVIVYFTFAFLRRLPPPFFFPSSEPGTESALCCFARGGHYSILLLIYSSKALPMFPNGSPLMESTRAASAAFEHMSCQARLLRAGCTD